MLNQHDPLVRAFRDYPLTMLWLMLGMWATVIATVLEERI